MADCGPQRVAREGDDSRLNSRCEAHGGAGQQVAASGSVGTLHTVIIMTVYDKSK
jgi:hypothetical protein